MMIEIQKNLKIIKRTNKGKKVRQLPLKLLENDLMQDSVESVY
jgi:phage anti-repressor protein